MQLDQTRIVVRERGIFEILDLSLHVTREFVWPLTVTLLIGVLPMMAINHLLIGWLSSGAEYAEEYPHGYVWNMILLIYVEAPLASIFATSYIGQAVFLERPSIRQVLRDVLKLLPRVVWCQMFVRGVAFLWLFALFIGPSYNTEVFVEVLLIPGLVLYAWIVRSVRPFINEIIILERNPLRSSNSSTMTVARRSSLLHGPSTGEMFTRYVTSSAIACLLTVAFYGAFLFLSGVFAHDWRQSKFLVEIVLPLSMWLVAGYMTVVRFLSYLDLRIRQEGWEVELRLRAEATKLSSKMV